MRLHNELKLNIINMLTKGKKQINENDVASRKHINFLDIEPCI